MWGQTRLKQANILQYTKFLLLSRNIHTVTLYSYRFIQMFGQIFISNAFFQLNHSVV